MNPLHFDNSMSLNRISLEHCRPIASGNNRDVFVHPDHADWLIKTIKPEALIRRSHPDAHWTKQWFRRYSHYETFLRECKEHIVAYLDPAGCPSFMQQIVGFAETDRGLGLITWAVRDRSGSYAKTLSKLIATGLYDDTAKAALNEFFASFLVSNVIVTDLGHGNLVYDDRDPEKPRFVVIDGYGEKNLIPFNSLFKSCHMRSKRKRVARLQNSVARALLKYANMAAPITPVL